MRVKSCRSGTRWRPEADIDDAVERLEAESFDWVKQEDY